MPTQGDLSRRQFFGIAGAVGATAALAACSGSGGDSDGGTVRLGIVPLLSSGTVFIAEAQGLFEKAGVKAEIQFFADGAQAVPALVAGQIDVSVATANAGLFNAVAKGASYKIFCDRGTERPDTGYLTVVVSNAMVERGVTSFADFARLKGGTAAIQSPGSIDQYVLGNALQKAGLNPVTDVKWTSGVTYPDMPKLLASGQADVAHMPLSLVLRTEEEKAGKKIGPGGEIVPGVQLATWAGSEEWLTDQRDTAVRFVMAHMHAAKIFNAAAKAPDKHPDVVAVLSEKTKTPKEVLLSTAPHWTFMVEDGQPNVESIRQQGRYWKETFTHLKEDLPGNDALFDLSVVRDARKRLASSNPFAQG